MQSTVNLFPFIPGYTDSIFLTDRQPALVMLIAFLITFLIARGYTRSARVRGWGSASFGGVHTHHLVFGLIFAFVAGALQFAFLPSDGSILQLIFAALFGLGVALVLDEFALLFHLDDVYWEEEGRKSVDAIVLGSIFGLLFLLHVTPLGGSDELTRTSLTIVQLINLSFVLIAALKGKLYMAVFGVFIPFVAFIGALRLAEPTSMWARHRYKPEGKHMKRSIKRYHAYEATWKPRKEYLWDLIGGKTGRPLPK